ncbi:MAG: AMIN domain-containing protein, partial [bacterium]
MLTASPRRAGSVALAALALSLALALAGCTSTSRTGSLGASGGAVATVNDIRMWHAPDRSRIVFDMDRDAAFDVFALKSPDRVVIDLSNARIKSAIPSGDSTGQFIRGIRHGARAGRTARMVLELNLQVRHSI